MMFAFVQMKTRDLAVVVGFLMVGIGGYSVIHCVDTVDTFTPHVDRNASLSINTFVSAPPVSSDTLVYTPSLLINTTQVVVFVPSPVQWGDRRKFLYNHFVRDGWNSSHVILLFVIGSKTGSQLEADVDTSMVASEFPPRDNVVYFISPCRDFGDEENNANGTSSTTCKAYEACKFIAEQYVAQYVWRGAEDSYLNLKYFFKIMPTLPSTRLYMGALRSVNGDSWDLLLNRQPAIQALLGIQQFGPYMFGMGYLFSYDVAAFIGAWAIPPRDLWCEDVMIGFWLRPFQIQWVDANQLGHIMCLRGALSPGISHTVLNMHYVQDQDWANIDNTGGIVV